MTNRRSTSQISRRQISRRQISRRQFARGLGISAAAANLSLALPSLGWAASNARKQRLVFVFSPNGVIPKHFWPETDQESLELKRILKPLAPFKDQVLTLPGLDNNIRGDGDGHMRGIGCLLTGIELFPGDVQGGSDTPAGWAKGMSIDQHLKLQLQADPATQTRFGSLEFGLLVPERADTWTRWSYTGPNEPVAPISDPYQMFNKLYGQTRNREILASVLDELSDDFDKIKRLASNEDQQMLERHLEMIRDVEKEMAAELKLQSEKADIGHAVPELQPNIAVENDNMPTISRMQTELIVNSLTADFTRIVSHQITNSVGNPRMRWLKIDEGHHTISHEPDKNETAYEQLIQINTWYCEQVAYLAKRLAETPEPGGDGSLLDNTTIVWTNELGKGNSHTRRDIPFVLVGGGIGWKTGRALNFDHVPHNRLLMSISEAMGHPVESFGNPDMCAGGVLSGLA
jgi:hypothetical protein